LQIEFPREFFELRRRLHQVDGSLANDGCGAVQRVFVKSALAHSV
jgi:hypothetical protein